MNSAEEFIPQVEVIMSHQLVGETLDKKNVCDRDILDDLSVQGLAPSTSKRSQEMSEALCESEKAMKKDQGVVSAIIERLGVELGGNSMGPAPPDLLKEISDASQKAIASRLAWEGQLAALNEGKKIEEALNAIGAESTKARSSRI